MEGLHIYSEGNIGLPLKRTLHRNLSVNGSFWDDMVTLVALRQKAKVGTEAKHVTTLKC